MRILGIDLATKPKNTGVVMLDIVGEQAVADIPEGPADDDALVAWARTADRIGVDAPLGWPTAFVKALGRHHSHEPWTGGADRNPLRKRRTDIALADTLRITPLSVSTDKLGATALRCALLQTLWADELWDGEFAARDGSGVLVEVYPAATLLALDIPHRSYKGTDGQSARILILERLQSFFDVDISAIADRCAASDHDLDALISGLAAWDAQEGRTILPTADQVPDALTEGWIHVRASGTV